MRVDGRDAGDAVCAAVGPGSDVFRARRTPQGSGGELAAAGRGDSEGVQGVVWADRADSRGGEGE